MQIDEFYHKYFDIKKSPYEHQRKLWELFECQRYPMLLKAPTGSGKTEAVIAPFLRQFLDNKFFIAPRLNYVLPMRVLVNSIADRIRGYTSHIDPSISVEVQHGDLPNSPFFISDIVVTTLDQFIYAFARASNQVGRHLDIPAGAVASSLVVFDEAHMYRDGFTFSMMRALMEILHESNIPFVTMTATMPESLEKSLFEHISIDDDCRILSDAGLRGEIRFSVQQSPLYESGEVTIPSDVLDKIGKGKSLIVLNQVERAKAVYDYFKRTLEIDEGQLVLLHSRFTIADREDHEHKAVELIKGEKRGIVVSTQVLEVGMDFSADVLITELAPADALIQRAGRCARYEGEQGEMFIFPAENRYPYEVTHQDETLKWLNANPAFDIKNFAQAYSFVDVLDYQADDFAARDSLIDLYEAALYADSRPQNIQVRDGKSCYLLVVNLAEGEGRKQDEKVLSSVSKIDFKEQLINVDIGVAWGLFKDGMLRWELRFNDKGKPEVALANQPTPYRTYILDSSFYDSNLGVKKDETIVI